MAEEKETRYVSLDYTIDLQLPGEIAQQARGSVTLNNRPFVLQKIKHLILATFDPDPATASLYNIQHGMYRLDWSIGETARFWKGTLPPMADSFGSVRHGIWYDLPAPIVIDGNDTLNVILTNQFRNPGPPPAEVLPYNVQVLFCGIERIE